jgi:uncharacterized repeat protein (TIGR01451 family)
MKWNLFAGALKSSAFRQTMRRRNRPFARVPLFLEPLEDRLAPTADLSVALTASPNPVIAGNQLKYTVVVTNKGPDNATGVTLSDLLPTGSTYVSSTTTQGTITAPGTVSAKSLSEDIYYTDYTGPNAGVEKVHFTYDGTTLTTSNNAVLALTGPADGLIFGPDGSLLAGGGNKVFKVNPSTGTYVTASPGTGATSEELCLDPSGTKVWTSGQPGEPTAIPLDPFGNGTPHPLTGDDTKITHIAFAPNGTAYYTSSSPNGPGDFGIINLTTFTTKRYISDLPAAHGIVFDPFTGDLILCGSTKNANALNDVGHVTQINPETMQVVSDYSTPSGFTFDQGNVDGFGHFFASDANFNTNTGHILFIDYSSTGLIGAASNFIKNPQVDRYVDDVAPESGLGSNPAVVTAALGSLANGASATATITVQVNPAEVGTFTDTATVTGNQPLPTPAHNTASVTTKVNYSADLAITQTVSTTSALETSNVVFTVTVTNKGPSAASGITVSDPLPAGLDFVDYTGSQGSTYDSGTGVWTVGSLVPLVPGASATLTLTAAGNASAVGKSFINTATIAGADQTDPNSTNNTASSPAVTISAAKFILTTPTPANETAGNAIKVKLTVEDSNGNVATNYRGKVYLTSSDGRALLPEDYTFTAADAGVHTFSVTLYTAGNQTISVQSGGLVSLYKPVTASGWFNEPDALVAPYHVTDGRLDDTGNGSTYSFWLTRPATLDYFVVDLEKKYSITSFRLQNTHTAKYNTYETARFRISVSSDGTHYTPVVQSTLRNVFGRTGALPIQDWNIPAITARYVRFDVLSYNGGGGGLNEIFVQTAPTLSAKGTISVAAAKTNHLGVLLPPVATAGSAISATVAALDRYGNVDPTYRGTVTFTESGTKGVVPANYIFTSSDNGTHTFTNDVIFITAGSQTLTATDVNTATITGTKAIQINPAAPKSYALLSVANVVAGAPLVVTVTTLDAYGNVETGYTGTIHFSSSDKAADLPDDYTFTGADNGQASFGAIFKTGGTQTLTVTDTDVSTVTSTTSVSVAAVTHFSISLPASITAGAPFTVTVKALDANGNVMTNYVGTIHFASSDKQATLPLDYTFVAGDAGVHKFTTAFTLVTAGSRNIRVSDTVVSWLTNRAGIVVKPAAAKSFLIEAPNIVTAGTSFAITVTVLDAYNNIVKGYTGTIHFTSSDSNPGLPANYTFVSGDNGTHTFTVTLNSVGPQTITATDTRVSTLTGSATVSVDTPSVPSRLRPGRLPRPGANIAALTTEDVSLLFAEESLDSKGDPQGRHRPGTALEA